MRGQPRENAVGAGQGSRPRKRHSLRRCGSARWRAHEGPDQQENSRGELRFRQPTGGGCRIDPCHVSCGVGGSCKVCQCMVRGSRSGPVERCWIARERLGGGFHPHPVEQRREQGWIVRQGLVIGARPVASPEQALGAELGQELVGVSRLPSQLTVRNEFAFRRAAKPCAQGRRPQLRIRRWRAPATPASRRRAAVAMHARVPATGRVTWHWQWAT